LNQFVYFDFARWLDRLPGNGYSTVAAGGNRKAPRFTNPDRPKPFIEAHRCSR